jgi:hypothetical protein
MAILFVRLIILLNRLSYYSLTVKSIIPIYSDLYVALYSHAVLVFSCFRAFFSSFF